MRNNIYRWAALYPRTFSIVIVVLINLIYLLLLQAFGGGQNLLMNLKSSLWNIVGFAVLMLLSWLWTRFINRKK
ncbi:putative sugar transport protein [Fructobacillus pseudoficulneus]|uniref:Putative sugar transport protein n=1 Tax=Fructobacillus pseudoficulneus TaxID=220714 RepID=A0A3F3H3Y2_9LACO|nr:hypothetical protein [Fructobacillus pseudoficulneus]GAP02760.1 putative sugar transport protein [Fructobacillus pseudoficulneus]SEH39696.1 hypothetical protein SAMN05660469_0699 [Fructobacillus pseudoficulneus]